MEVCTHDNGNSMGVLTIQPKYSYIFDRQRAEWCFDFYGEYPSAKTGRLHRVIKWER